MSSKDNLDVVDLATIKALAEACNDSLHAHPPEHAILKRFPTHLHGDVRKSLKKLHRKNLCIKHPTGGETTYYINKESLTLAKML